MTYSELETAIYNWVNANTNLLVIFEDENGARPTENYMSLKVGTINQIGQRDYTAPDNTTGIRDTRIVEDFNLAIRAFGSGSKDELQLIKDSLQKESVIDDLRIAGLAFRDESTIQDISISIDDLIEKRYIYELVGGFSHSFEEEVGVIETVDYSSTINQPV